MWTKLCKLLISSSYLLSRWVSSWTPLGSNPPTPSLWTLPLPHPSLLRFVPYALYVYGIILGKSATSDAALSLTTSCHSPPQSLPSWLTYVTTALPFDFVHDCFHTNCSLSPTHRFERGFNNIMLSLNIIIPSEIYIWTSGAAFSSLTSMGACNVLTNLFV